MAMADAKLVCTECGKQFPIPRLYQRCDTCREPLEIRLEGRTHARVGQGRNIFHRYRDFFALPSVVEDAGLGEGCTPLTRSGIVSQILGIARLYFKNETMNPTWSFKDRGTAAGIQHALSLGFRRIGTVSTGNMAASVAAYGARAGLETYVLVSQTIPPEKIPPIGIYRPHILVVDGDIGEIYKRSNETGEKHGIYFINADVPFRIEGSKTIAFEICEELGFAVPDWVVVPVSAGGNFRGILKGFLEFREAGLIASIPRMIAAQASGCSPIATAFDRGSRNIERFQHPHTIAHAIESPFPPSGNETLRLLRKYGGLAVSVTDPEILSAQALMAREGIFGQPASAVPLAAVKKLLFQGALAPSDSIVCIVTGCGLKYTAALDYHPIETVHTDIAGLEDALGDANATPG
jgi:threonine synthase